MMQWSLAFIIIKWYNKISSDIGLENWLWITIPTTSVCIMGSGNGSQRYRMYNIE